MRTGARASEPEHEQAHGRRMRRSVGPGVIALIGERRPFAASQLSAYPLEVER